MSGNEQSIVWITGATQGIGAGLARAVPYPNARVINISRRRHPDLESVVADLTDPASWDLIAEQFASELSSFGGERAVFIHNANYSSTSGFVGENDPDEYRKQVLANAAASLVLGDAFVRACDPRFESGLVMISSAAARHAMEGMAVYGAAKAGMEQWVRGVRAERKRRGTGPWVIAIRPGFVATEQMLASRQQYATGGKDFPGGAAVLAALDAGQYLTPDESARQIWELLPPDPEGRNVYFVGEFVEGAGVDATSKSI
jgi:NAD(P)-dependent dehydrogenase (short-subunit alcohol dehydrogenase family)